jgi:hypothetical protein
MDSDYVSHGRERKLQARVGVEVAYTANVAVFPVQHDETLLSLAAMLTSHGTMVVVR